MAWQTLSAQTPTCSPLNLDALELNPTCLVSTERNKFPPCLTWHYKVCHLAFSCCSRKVWIFSKLCVVSTASDQDLGYPKSFKWQLMPIFSQVDPLFLLIQLHLDGLLELKKKFASWKNHEKLQTWDYY